MLRVTIELVPGGFEPLRRSVGKLRISNLSNLADVSNYHLLAQETANPLTGTPPRVGECILVGHCRLSPSGN